jgi:hypothetical protein
MTKSTSGVFEGKRLHHVSCSFTLLFQCPPALPQHASPKPQSWQGHWQCIPGCRCLIEPRPESDLSIHPSISPSLPSSLPPSPPSSHHSPHPVLSTLDNLILLFPSSHSLTGPRASGREISRRLSRVSGNIAALPYAGCRKGLGFRV